MIAIADARLGAGEPLSLTLPREGRGPVSAPSSASDRTDALLRFRQGDRTYAIPARHLIAAIGIEHLQHFTPGVDGWAGAVAVQGGTLPVFDGGILLGQGGSPQTILILRLASGPLGLAVERIESLLDGEQPWRALPAYPVGLLGAYVQDHAATFVLDPAHLDALRQRAIQPDENGRSRPRPLQWQLPASETVISLPLSPAAPQLGYPVLVLGEAAASEPTRGLAIGVEWVVAVAERGELYEGPPSPLGLVGFRTWGNVPLPVIDPIHLGIAAATGQASGFLLVLKTGVGVLTAQARGVQALRHVAPTPEGAAPWFAAYGAVRGPAPAPASGRSAFSEPSLATVALLDPIRLASQLLQNR